MVKNYMPPEVFDGFSESSSRYALCLVDKDMVIGVGVFDARQSAHIQSIRVLEDYRGETDMTLLNAISDICRNLGADGVVFEIYDGDDPDFWEPLLLRANFYQEQTVVWYEFPVSSLQTNALLSRAHSGKNVVPLRYATGIMRRKYGNILVSHNRYDKFTDGDFHEDLSAIYLDAFGQIAGCVLVRDLGRTEGFSIEYANTDNIPDNLALIKMLKFVSDGVLSYYDYKTAEPMGYALAMNDVSGQIIEKLLPEAEDIDHVRSFVKVLSATAPPSPHSARQSRY